ncbi:MAG: hypothetical protein JXK94_00890 [Deltaproteobacteria bacterium]|nr:hypothetical protein [Deltaproteobacteria bacterium]
MEFNVQYRDGFFEVEILGETEPEKYRDVFETLVAHGKWQPGTSCLVNQTELNSKHLTTDETRDIAEFSAEYSVKLGKSKCALLFSRDLEYGLGRMWQTFVENEWEVSVMVFKSRDEALAWLTG